MDYNAVYHRAYDNFCYALNEEELVINIKTGYDVIAINLIQADPFEAGILGGAEEWNGSCIPIHFKKQLPYQVWWTQTVKPRYKRLRYYFELFTETEKFYYFEDGIVTEDQMHLQGRSRQCFIEPWMNKTDINTTPKWVNDTIWYQIFPDRFCNGNPARNPEWVKEWRESGSVTNEEFFGGDLEGIISKLDYISELGVNGIYLTPIMLSESTHKYDTDNYEMIDPHFGDEEILKSLVRKAHERGIRIMLDGVFNHSGRNFQPWRDVVKNGPSSRYYDWFMIYQWPFDYHNGASRKGQYATFAFHDDMPKLNTNCREVREYFIRLCTKWITEYDIDGIRLDVANEVSHTFCKELHHNLKALKPDIYILGEIWHDAMPWLRGDEFDAVMNYPLASSIKDFWIDKSLHTKDFEYTINRCFTNYMQQTNDVLFNLLDSHDTKRLRSEVNTTDEFYAQLAVLMAMPGSPCIFYGTEIAMEGNHDPDCRRCMPWGRINNGEYENELGTVKAFIKLRREQPLLRGRNFHFPDIYKNGRVIHFLKLGWIDQYIEVIINCEQDSIRIEEGGNILFSRLYHDGKLEPEGVLFRSNF